MMSMDWVSGEIAGALAFLLPGFVAAAIFYSLTSHPRPGEFDRIIQALIFTVLAQAIAAAPLLAGGVFFAEPSVFVQGYRLVAPVAVAVVLGLAAVYAANNDAVHGLFRRLGFTLETSYPSEWYYAFALHHDCYVVLHFKDGRYLYGWLGDWPKRTNQGHFQILEGEWLGEEDGSSSASVSSTFLIAADQVAMIEFTAKKIERR